MYTFSQFFGCNLKFDQVQLSEAQKKEKEWISACKVDTVDKSDEYDPFLVGAYSKPIFEYLMTLEVIANKQNY